MATSFGALCTDFYVNSKLALKMDLPGDRETLLQLFERVSRTYPSMDQFHRYEGELVLESSRREAEYRWLSLRRTSIRAGHVNPSSMEEAYKFHRLLLELTPHFLSISPLDVDYLELLFGFDMECKANHDQVVYEALFANSPLAQLLRIPGARMIDVQPIFGVSLTRHGEMQAFFEVKTRTRNRRGAVSRYADEPLSIFVTVRKYGPVRRIEQLLEDFETLRLRAETLTSEHAIPDLVLPIARQITSSST